MIFPHRIVQFRLATAPTMSVVSERSHDAALRRKLRTLARERHRFGYRGLFVLLSRDDEASGRNGIYWLYRKEGLSVRKRRGPALPHKILTCLRQTPPV